MIEGAFVPDELSSLIEAVFSNLDEVNTIRGLRGDDAQTFIDMIDEVGFPPACHHEIRSIDGTFD